MFCRPSAIFTIPGRRSRSLSLRSLAAMSKSRTFKSSAPKRSDVPPGYVEDLNAGPMLRFEASLPRLPVPPLSSTTAKYLETVQPHLTPAQFSATQAAVKAFLDSPQSKELQQRLEARAREPGMRNWLADWWNEAAYMGYRDPVVVYVSYFYVHMDDKRKPSQARRAAELLKAMLPFRTLVESKQLEPEKIRSIPLSMESYKWLFHSSRYPVKPSDTAKKFDSATHNHVVFVRKNKFYQVQLVDKSGRELTAAELEAQIEKVITMAGSDKAIPVGALTGENRDTWADARSALLAASPSNAVSLEAIESAMIIVCLDDLAPVTREDASWGCWVGDGRNRFYDKHQLIVFENGKSGFLGEHSCMDGTPTLRLNEFTLASLAAGKVDLGPARTEDTGRDLDAPQELPFVVDAKTQTYITQAEAAFDDLVGKHDMQILHYEGYGKEYIKKFKASPDAWAQLVKQLAFHKMFNRPGVCYESAQTRKYQLGRTEVIRSASNESRAWAEAMLNPDKTDEHRAALFRRAVARHLQYAAWAADGQGLDRHLFGLKMMLRKNEPVPPIYTDEAYSKTNHWELSTSNLSSPLLDGWGYGEVVPDGYGLSYSIGDDYLRWTITSLKLRTAELKHYLAEAATETRQMMERAAAAETKKASEGKAKL
ncbi:acyltransferase ChoActase/COT/CPT [Wolfiporia cocos MD-104 SS10]|uniref:Carnitine O-acetyltransferase, mitochondrial n=1 Tax=Wolfiporia cocos (strain MD-104) TaxID=742152 RepID=A0A2H3JDJ3_WOLCO|nr:acyltransferase ChoActase/COT/CPT [Wolfiporia cocos MD-104 SS10]